MKIQKVELANKISKLKAIVPKQTPMSALQTIMYKEGYLIASDMEITVTVKLEGIAEGIDESFLIPDSLFQLIGSLPSGPVEIKVIENNGKTDVIELKAGKIKNKFQAPSIDNFPARKPIEKESVQSVVDAEDLKAGIQHVLYAVDEKSANKKMTALCMECKNGELNLTGLDGHMIAWDKVPLEGEFKLLVPKRACQQILNLDLQGEVKITADNYLGRFESEFVTVETRIIDGDFFNYEKLFSEYPNTAAINRKSFIDAIARVNACRAEGEPVKMTFDEDAVKIELVNNRQEYMEELSLKDKIEQKVIIGMDPRLLSASLKSFDSEDIYMNMTDAKSPMKLLSDESDMKAIVLPIAIRTE